MKTTIYYTATCAAAATMLAWSLGVSGFSRPSTASLAETSSAAMSPAARDISGMHRNSQGLPNGRVSDLTFIFPAEID